MPLFAFWRSRDVELEAGFILAGTLVLDVARLKNKSMPKRTQRLINEIVQRLSVNAQSGRMANYDSVFGWPAEHKPLNAVDTSDEALMTAWAKDRLIIAVRVDHRNDGFLRVDSDMMRQMGLAVPAPDSQQ